MPFLASRSLRAILTVLVLAGCGCGPAASVEPNPDPDGDGTAPTVTIVTPTEGAVVATAPDAERSLMVDFTTTNLILKAPGTCLASDGPCGHVVVQVDGETCNADGTAFNSIATTSPARANLARCSEAAGSHTVTLSVARDDRTAWTADDVAISASVTVTAALPPLLERLGGPEGLRSLAGRIIEGQIATSSVSGYFRNDSVDHEQMEICLGEMLVSMVDQGSPVPSECDTDMGAVHAGLGISGADFDDWLAIFDAAGSAEGVPPEDLDVLRASLNALGDQIVEDPDSDASLYQRLGRRPGIGTVAQTFATKLSMHAEVSRYFLNDDGLPEYSPVLAVCLTRLLGGLDGPFDYGGEAFEPALDAEGRQCRGMVESHDGVTSAAPQSAPIGPAEFLEVAFILVDALLYHEVPQEDVDIIVQAMNLPALCTQIIADPTECDGLF
ncbi:MAG: hypothetical protein KDA24_08890 [Deltaproteobacteria bacterium]|nr:hypothetical protein [Deltaproteobacteria bacterium]